jgi:hypothetical protein
MVMTWRTVLLTLVVGAFWVPWGTAGEGRVPLRLLYVGDDKARAADYAAFLEKHFAQVRVAGRTGFDPAAAREADVVLLDWSQAETDVRQAKSPFGKLEDWSRPTVLLGSAGLFMAGRWQLIGGAG